MEPGAVWRLDSAVQRRDGTRLGLNGLSAAVLECF